MIGIRDNRIVAQDIRAQQECAAAGTNDQRQAIEQPKNSLSTKTWTPYIGLYYLPDSGINQRGLRYVKYF